MADVWGESFMMGTCIYIYTPLVFRNRLERSVIYIWNITTVSTVIVILFRHATIPCLSFYARCVPFSIFFFFQIKDKFVSKIRRDRKSIPREARDNKSWSIRGLKSTSPYSCRGTSTSRSASKVSWKLVEGGGGAPPSNTLFETAGTRTLESDRALNAPLAARAVAWRARALLLGGYPLPFPPLCSRG